MTQLKYRHPSEMVSDEKRTPVSARVKVSTKKLLEKSAQTYGLSLALLIANIVDDYGDWLRDKSKNRNEPK